MEREDDGQCLLVRSKEFLWVEQPSGCGKWKYSNEDRVATEFIKQHLGGCQLTCGVALKPHPTYQDRLVSHGWGCTAVQAKGSEKDRVVFCNVRKVDNTTES